MRFSRQTSPHGSLVALSTMKDEGPFVVEWVAHHLAVGFTKLMVYTNDCSDGTDTLLKRLEALDIGVHHRENVIPAGIKPHPSMLKLAVQDDLSSSPTGFWCWTRMSSWRSTTPPVRWMGWSRT